jgi:hypothetical protein
MPDVDRAVDGRVGLQLVDVLLDADAHLRHAGFCKHSAQAARGTAEAPRRRRTADDVGLISVEVGLPLDIQTHYLCQMLLEPRVCTGCQKFSWQ